MANLQFLTTLTREYSYNVRDFQERYDDSPEGATKYRACWNPHCDLLFDSTSRISIFNLRLLLDRTFWRAISKSNSVENWNSISCAEK